MIKYETFGIKVFFDIVSVDIKRFTRPFKPNKKTL